MANKSSQQFDVVIIGAGISGIDAAYRLQEQCAHKSYTILESRENMGGTWDLFKYPGIRSDSDLHTFGFPFRPWEHKHSIAEAPLIVEYVKSTAAKFGIDKHIQYRHKVDAADWSSEQQQWTLSVTADGKPKKISSQFVFVCTGYYDYKSPLAVKIPGLDNFKGQIIHPQFWPEDLDYANKKVVIIGSGATAITILPNIAKKAAYTTMLQRSPTYIVALPQNDPISNFLRAVLPAAWAFKVIRLRWIIYTWFSFTLFTAFPNLGRFILRRRAQRELPKGYNMDPNFNPRYNPWQQRLCVSPNGDFFEAIRGGRANIVTANIETVTNNTIKLKDGRSIEADIIITATGLKIQVAGGAKIRVDGKVINPGDHYVYRHAMLNDVPNAALFIGYVNASWTLGADATAHYMCRLINSMDKSGAKSATPKVRGEMKKEPILSLNSTYITEGAPVLPSCGNKPGWMPRDMYFTDLWEAWRGDFNDMDFQRSASKAVPNGLVQEKLKEVDAETKAKGRNAPPVEVV